jgi:hypothetical protein
VKTFADMLGKPHGTSPERQAEIIDGALEELAQRGVWQGGTTGPHGEACTVTALCTVTDDMHEISDIERTLVEHLGMQGARSDPRWDDNDPWALRPTAQWNDFLAAGPDEIITVLTEVRDKLRANETHGMETP